MRIMLMGDRIIGGNSAYSKVGRELCTRLTKMGHKVAHTPMGRANKMGKQWYEGVLIQPSGDDWMSEDNALSNYTDFGADLLITVKDLWALNYIPRMPTNFCPLVPIDHANVSEAIVARLAYAYKPITISRHGQAELRRKRIESVYIPHGVDCNVFTPLTPQEKMDSREMFGLPKDGYIVTIFAMNRSRKGVPRMLRGVARFRELYPDVNIYVALWSNVQPHRPNDDFSLGVSDVGVNLLPEIQALGLADRVRFPDWRDVERLGGLPDRDPNPKAKDVRKLLGCSDVNLLCSMGEGAGLTYLEAAATEVPSIGTNYAAAPEYIGAGFTVNWHDYFIFSTPGVRYVLPDVDGMAEALNKVYNADREKLGKKCRRFAEAYDYDLVMEMYWKPFLSQCENELYPLLTKEGERSWAPQ